MCGVSLTGERARSDCLCHIQDCMGGKWGSAPTLGHVEPSLAQRDPRACSKAWGMRDVCGCCDGCLAPTHSAAPRDGHPGTEHCRCQPPGIGKGVEPLAAASLRGFHPPRYSPALCCEDEISSALGRQELSGGSYPHVSEQNWCGQVLCHCSRAAASQKNNSIW